MNEKKYQFTAVIQKVPEIDGAYIEFPYDVRAEFGKGRVKVQVVFDGTTLYDGSLVKISNPIKYHLAVWSFYGWQSGGK